MLIRWLVRRASRNSTESPPPRPATVRVALWLIYLIIALRVAMIFGRLEGLGRLDGPLETPLGSRQVSSFGLGVASFWLLPLVLVARRLIRYGYGWAAGVYLVYLLVRGVRLLLAGPYVGLAGALLLTMVCCGWLLLHPTSRNWFAACGEARARSRHVDHESLPNPLSSRGPGFADRNQRS